LEGWFAHVPGLRVLAPATIEDARGMLWPALEHPDPVIIFEHAQLYNVSGVLDGAGSVDLVRARTARSGRDLTLITFGGMLPRTLEAAVALAAEGIEAEVIDLRVLRPLDDVTIMRSVARTRRAIIVEEAWRSGGFAAEVSARILEQAFFELDAPVQRVCGEEVPMPYARELEVAALPSVARIMAAARGLFGRKPA
jgi:pyruvate dehydrogenase E1 component beta subunit